MDVEGINDNSVLEEEVDELFGTLSMEDWITIETIQSLFVSIFQAQIGRAPDDHFDLSSPTSAILSWSAHINKKIMYFIDFFRGINEFQNLPIDDRLILIKYNLFPVAPICKCYQFKFANDHFCLDAVHHEGAEFVRFYTFLNASDNISQAFINAVSALHETTDGNPTILSLLLVILILTTGLSMHEDEPPLNDPLAVNRVQSYYTELLWKYLVYQLGEIQACKRFIRLSATISQMQSTSHTLRLFAQEQCRASNTVDKLTPLMQSVLNIS